MKYSSVDLFGVRIDQVTMDQALSQVEEWCNQKSKHYIVTPNVEFVMKAQEDTEFKRVLNEADLAIPDSSRFGWALAQQSDKNLVTRLLRWPLFLIKSDSFPVVTGTDLMQHLCKVASTKGWTVGLIGGRGDVAVKSAKKLQKRYPGLKVSIADSGPMVNKNGETLSDDLGSIPDSDILFVGFGQQKQEKWISKNLNKLPIKVAMGVGGAFDYFSEEVARAPLWMRQLGLEWLFRLILQPWRAKRFINLICFVFKVSF